MDRYKNSRSHIQFIRKEMQSTAECQAVCFNRSRHRDIDVTMPCSIMQHDTLKVGVSPFPSLAVIVALIDSFSLASSLWFSFFLAGEPADNAGM